MSLEDAARAFEARYRRYLGEIVELKGRTAKVRRASTFLSLRRPFADDPIHAQARSDLEALAAGVSACLAGGAGGGEPLARAVRLVLGEKRIDVAEYWSLVALEGLAMPWLAHLDRADLERCHREYVRANPRSGCLPNQKKLRKEFERLLASS